MKQKFFIKKFSILFLIIFICNSYITAQEALKSTEEEYYDFLSLQGLVDSPTLGYRTLSDNVWNFTEEDAEHIWQNNNLGSTKILWQPSNLSDNWFANGLFQGFKYKIFCPQWFNSYNTAAPYGQNDGALWQGKGYNTALTTGLRLEGYGFELTFKPQISWMQNLEFDYIPGVYGDTHSYNWVGNVDLVQRYGDSSFWNYDWGDSEVRWIWHSLTFGFGTQNPWLGPAYLNPMLGSNNAAGYPKFDAGLRETQVVIPWINWDLGSIEGRIWVGKLQESDYFDNNETNNQRMLTAMSASYKPSFIPGFTFGLNRIFLTYWKTENYKYILRLFTLSRSNALSSSGNDEDQKFSIFINWDFPNAGFNVYGEFGRDDFSYNELTNPFHTAIYTVGAKQIIPIKLTSLFPNLSDAVDLKSEFNFEWNNFEMSQDFQLQWPYMGYYAHGFVKQGYTNKGQILGAGTGYFGNSQFVQYKVYYPKGYTAFKFHRFTPNINSIYSKAVNESANNANSELNKKWYTNFETYYCFGIETNYFLLSNLNFIINYSYERIYNYTNVMYKIVHNHSINLSLKYNL